MANSGTSFLKTCTHFSNSCCYFYIKTSMSNPVRDWVKFLSKLAGRRYHIFSLFEQLLFYDFKPFVFVLSFFTFIQIRLFALICPPCYKYATLIMCIHPRRYPCSFIRRFGFILSAANDCVYTSERAIDRCFENVRKFSKISDF